MNKAIFKVIKPGLQTTIQDFGRFGFQQYGISPSGAMDVFSLQIANILTGNPLGSAALEAVLAGPEIEILSDITVAICGGDFSPKVDGHEVLMWKSISLKKGQILSIGSCRQGARAYIAFSGGIDVPEILGSKSTFLNGGFGGLEGRALQSGDILLGNAAIMKPLKFLHPELIPTFHKTLHLRVILGPHEKSFTKQSIQRFLNETYTLTPQSNRMGIQLKGPKLDHLLGPDIISDPVPFGGIQVPSSGQPIILMVDRQTTGGYTRIATVISADIPLLAQAVPDTKITFSTVSVEEAHRLYFKRHRLIKLLAATIK
ncbi:biotin-dependent carboxyltransferase family protein [Bacillus sp. BRMEA1]|uniref:5-oxoprolinase subunit C family protein n=1 Tax=Neobacillus endophyticus TaxID=2738405 RepID=UPI0015644051|nr:biotin-dependent carboxyltransferase family protein [Neobacillus endophyticus]NRD76351.1 biotin-dependent carboxyltransferase family protein [Neobacillus endophyticus]